MTIIKTKKIQQAFGQVKAQLVKPIAATKQKFRDAKLK
jgi:hypothetical protein